MKKLLFQFFTAVLFLLIINSCYREKLVGEYYLTDDLKDQNPFQGYEKLSFVDKDRSTIDFSGEGRINEINKMYTTKNNIEYALYEEDYINFINQNYRLNIYMEASFFQEKMNVSFIYLDSTHLFYSNYKSELNANQPNYLDSLLVNNVWIHNVFYDTMKFTTSKPFPDELTSYPVKSYYTTNYGIVKIDFSDNSSWELEKTEW